MKRYLLPLLLFFTQIMLAQSVTNTTFKTLGIVDGLRSNAVTSLLADSRGYLWIGTYQGLNRYDGHQVKIRFPESSIPQLHEVFDQTITSIEEDAAGHIWIETESGSYSIYDTRIAQFNANPLQLLHSLGMHFNGAFKVKVGAKGALWVLTEHGIFRYDYHTKELNSWEKKTPLPGKTAHVVAEVSDGLYFSANHAVWHFHSSTGELYKEKLPEVMNQSIGETSMMADADGTLWVYSTREEHICRLIVGGRYVNEMVNLPYTSGASLNNAIRDMMDDQRGNIWIATDHKGLFIYNKNTGAITSLRHQREKQLSLPSDNVTCLTSDRDGTIWVGHLKAGLSYTSNANNIMQPHALKCGDILAMAYDTHGHLWMGTDGDGVYIEKADGSIIKTSLPNITVMSLLSDGHGGMWAGTYNQGLYHLVNASQWKRYATELGTFPSETVWTLAADNNGRIWSSSPIGKTVIFNPQDESTHVVTTDNGEDIRGNAVRYDGDGTMYIGSVYGLWRYQLATNKCSVSFGNKHQTQQWMSQMIIDVKTDKRQGLMILVHPDGMTVFDTKRDTLSYIQRTTDIIKGLVSDHEGTYWVCTTSGTVVGILPQRHRGGIELIRRSFQPYVGMPQFYFNGDAMTLSPNGQILMGGTEGYMSINPHQLMASKAEDRPLSISEIAVGDSLINERTTTINLNYDDAYLSVRFFAGSLENVRHTRYAYRLVGQTSDWVLTDQPAVSFHALPPGQYTLQLCVCREDGSMSPPQELTINVAPPFYRTIPMYCVYALMAIAILLFIRSQMHKRQQARSEQQRQMMERQKIEQITEMKLQFFTNISHDLRTPLTLIISPLEQIIKKLEQGSSINSLQAQLHNVYKNAQLLLQEVNSLLDFRRLDAGGETLNLQRGDIVDHLNSILVSFGDYAEERGIHLAFEHEVDSYVLDYDREKMNKVIYNLFSNALKFTPAGGSVTLRINLTSTYVLIAVADTGKGIPDADKPNIFKRFYQSSSNDSSQTGSGIGLHIANDYVKLHHGTISVADNHPKGSIFTITLPIASNSHQIKAEAATDGAATTEPFVEPQSNTRKSILVVDDNQDMLSFVSSCMKEYFDVYTASDGAEALQVLQQQQIDLVISDVMMPGIDGFELCRRVKTDINLSHIPVILLTARTTDVSRIEGLQLGADDYLTKPFNVEVLRLRVQKFIDWEQNNHHQFRQKLNIEPSEITITPLDEQFIQKVISLVEKNISDSEFSVEAMAAEVAMSRSTLYKKLMAITGQGPAEFIRTIRIKRGRALLESSQMQITEIAYAVGFTTVKSFTMNFKAVYGVTPSEFQKSNLSTVSQGK
ncbi:two-component regulator propeller domain-containing protein [Prevotella sp. MA2016]|uniref:hybrid sensor histidine kinase/response regulator n=1 Tax=Prevotella sp. MA2016 TaxID=1408310 RepID=UPI0009DCD572|nr:two-component regulator propeller domain-containing protein [Prevotella sp. MA2016]